ncbi:MAG: S16 family serine protease, partial [Candidatus Kerfeldbacteria bacterium]
AKTSFGFPQRKCSGFDLNRLNVLLAVLMRRAGIAFDQHDVYINVVGGASLSEPSMDLAVCLALVSALNDMPLGKDVAAWGEVGLGGELRSVSRGQGRAKEATRFGFKTVISNKEAKTLAEAIQKAGLRP